MDREAHKRREKAEFSLLEAIKYEIRDRLNFSLSGAELIKIRKKTQPNLVWKYQLEKVKFSTQKSKSFSQDIVISEIFNQAHGKLLLLGSAGSGKTTELLVLAKELIAKAEENSEYPIPVVFELGTWDNNETIEFWSADQLKKMYPFLGKYAQQLFRDRKILPIFDGLDEVKSEWQRNCIQAINQFMAEEFSPEYLVVCSRYEAYQQAIREIPIEREHEVSSRKQLLRLNEAVVLKKLTDSQIKGYLSSIKQLDVWQTISQDADLLSLVKQPLFLSMIGFVCVHDELSISEWKALKSAQERKDYLFNAYWNAAMKRELIKNSGDLEEGIRSQAYKKCLPPTESKIIVWLSWLARKMEIEQETKNYFLIEQLQPSWLDERKDKARYFFVYVSLISFPVAFAAATVQFFRGGFLFWETQFLAISVLLIAVYRVDEIIVRRVPKLSFKNLSDGFREGLWYSLLSAFLIGVLFGYKRGLVVAVSSGMITAMISSVGFYVNSALTEPTLEENLSSANQGIIRLLYNSIAWPFLGLLIGTAWILIFLIREWISYLLVPNSTQGGMLLAIWFGSKFALDPITGFCNGILIGLALGGIAFLRHFSLRIILFRKGFIPWDYSRFLNYCVEREFLQRVGGRYKFIHPLFQKYVADLEN
ncbi:NACHT domain-containing protein [Almyronema epifaneia]|uniref:NACHT domain-containing protein n=1 Tax=Almyronema epifaneia S1 TaxID=2991925 RepID=A0ABW6IE32_9CYAN